MNSLSFAVALLIGNSQALRQKWIDGEYENDFSQQEAIDVADSNKIFAQTDEFRIYVPSQYTEFAQSDPIHGSGDTQGLAKYEDLTEEQQFELDQRKKVPRVYTLDEDVLDNMNSIKVAEAIVGGKMASPTDPKELAKDVPAVIYHYADSDDEDEETRETRRSIKTAEKMLKQRFFINAKDRSEYEKAALAGKISEEDLNFAEDMDEPVVPIAEKKIIKAKEAAKKAVLQKEAAKAVKKAQEQIKKIKASTPKPVRKGEPYVTPIPKPKDRLKHKRGAKGGKKNGKKGEDEYEIVEEVVEESVPHEEPKRKPSGKASKRKGKKGEDEYEIVEEVVEELVPHEEPKGKKLGKKTLILLNQNDYEENI